MERARLKGVTLKNTTWQPLKADVPQTWLNNPPSERELFLIWGLLLSKTSCNAQVSPAQSASGFWVHQEEEVEMATIVYLVVAAVGVVFVALSLVSLESSDHEF